MRELSDEAQSMLNAARGAHDPTDRDRKRLMAAMVGQLGAAAMISSTSTLAAAAGGSAAAGGMLGAIKVIASVAALTFAAGTVAWETTRPTHVALVRKAAPQRVASPFQGKPVSASLLVGHPGVPSPILATLPPIAIASVASATSTATPPLPAQVQTKPLSELAAKRDALAEQVRVLAAARSELREGRAELALAALESHAEVFQQSMLREEYLAARVLALRALGHFPDAQAAAASFAEEMPHSALASKIRAVPTEQVQK